MEKLITKQCCDCSRIISFTEFRINNPLLSKEAASDLWENPLIKIYCVECFLNRPEKPYRKRKRFYSYYQFKF
ncbi:MAG: hypothetical protein ACFFBW_10795, partial [Promethearchaeota archaeon]